MKLILYINGDIVDFYSDEKVQLNRAVQNVRDITKIFSDFSQSFKVPASPRNNKIFKHYYNVDIVGGFDARTRQDAKLELRGLPFQDGRIELESVTMKNGRPVDYKITFYSNLVRLSDLFADDKLSDLDLTSYDHPYSFGGVRSGISGYVTGTGNNVIYPMLFQRNVTYDAQGTTLADTDIKYDTTTQEYGLSSTDFKASLRMSAILSAIQTKYGVTFTSTFFSSDVFTNLWMWMSNSKEQAKCNSNTDIIDLINAESGLGTWNQSAGTFIPDDNIVLNFKIECTDETKSAEFKVDVVRVDNGTIYESVTHLSNQDSNEVSIMAFAIPADVEIRIDITSDKTFRYKSILEESTIQDGIAETQNYFGASPYFEEFICDFSISKNIPDMSVTEFMNSLFKMFNLTIVSSGSDYIIEPLNDWYALGTDIDITKYIKTDNLIVEVPPVNNEINFEFAENDAITSERYRENNEKGYGDSSVILNLDGGVINFNTSFTNLLMERMTNVSSGALTTLLVGKSIDDKLEAITIPPFVHYVSSSTITTTDTFCYLNPSGNNQELSEFWRVGASYIDDNSEEVQSINFDVELNPFSFIDMIETLYANYYEDYITDIYSSQRRMFSVDAILPIGVLIKLELNDKVVIQGTKYIINTMRVDLVTGETKFVLLNDV